MTDHESQWKYLGDAEKTTCEEYTFLRRLMDWTGYDDAQEQRRKAAWHWLDARADEYNAGDHETWSHAAERADYIDAVLHGYDELHYGQESYPRDWMPGGHDDQNVYVKERCYYLKWQSQYDEQTARKTANLNRLQEERQDLWRYAEEHGWDGDHRKQRYDNLQIATHYGSAWDAWKNGTYKFTDPDPKFDPHPGQGESSSSGGSWRDKSAKWHDGHLGITESPADSNCDSRSDGIRTSQDGCANGTWLRYQPWCGCWAWSGLYAAGKVAKGESWLASVASIEDYAKAAKGPFRGWTTDGTKAKKGDLVVLFGRGQHVGTVRSIDADYAHTWEGNTSSSSGSGGSQSNGGGSYKRSRSRHSETYGYALVRD
jgi:hypothetical protein